MAQVVENALIVSIMQLNDLCIQLFRPSVADAQAEPTGFVAHTLS